MSKILVISLLFLCSLVYAQEPPEAMKLSRFFLDVSPTIGMHKHIDGQSILFVGGGQTTSNPTEYGRGAQFKAGNNWYLKRGKFCGILHLTWIRLGFMFSDGLVLYTSPLNLGVGHHFQLSQKISINTSVHSGVVFVMDDYLDIGGFVDYFIMPEIKLNIGNFTLGVEYSRKNELNDYYSTPDRYYHYFGLSLGSNF